jgi:outer membrane protein insertion porin family
MHKPGRVAAIAILMPALILLCRLPVRAQGDLIISLEVTGNEYISRDAILDAVQDSLKIGSAYSDQAAQEAKAAILRMGYFADAAISYETTPDGTKVTINVVERKRIEKIAFVGNTVFADSALLDVIHTKVGQVLDNEVITRDVHRIEDYYTKAGYIAHIAQARVDDYGVLTFVIDEARVEAIKIQGLKKTKEWVVRRLITTKPGDLFRQDRWQKDMERIFNLGIFQTVKTADLRPGVIDPTAVIAVVQIEEKRTGTASVAAAYSELDNFVFMTSVAETNFRGRAETASIDMEAFGINSVNLRFFEPYLDKKNTTMDVSLFDTEQRQRFVPGGIAVTNDEFDERREGASVRLSRPVTLTQRFTLGLQSERVYGSSFDAERNIGNNDGPGTLSAMQLGSGAVHPAQVTNTGSSGNIYYPIDPNAPPGPGDITGPIVVTAPLHPGGFVNSTTFEYTWDTRDIIADPKKGMYRDISWVYAGGLLGGQNTYNLYSAEQRGYWAIPKTKDVIAIRLMAGTSSGAVPLFDSWSVGGAMNLRGYQEERFRGENMVVGNFELRHQMSDSLGFVGFVDVGDAYGGTFPTVVPGFNIPADDQNLNLHIGVGAGIRAQTPLGPIRIDWGFGSDGNQVHFGFGQIF